MKKRKQCYNCRFVGQSFKIGDLTHHHCEHPKYTKEQFESGEVSPWDTLVKFSDTCDDHKFKCLTPSPILGN